MVIAIDCKWKRPVGVGGSCFLLRPYRSSLCSDTNRWAIVTPTVLLITQSPPAFFRATEKKTDGGMMKPWKAWFQGIMKEKDSDDLCWFQLGWHVGGTMKTFNVVTWSNRFVPIFSSNKYHQPKIQKKVHNRFKRHRRCLNNHTIPYGPHWSVHLVKVHLVFKSKGYNCAQIADLGHSVSLRHCVGSLSLKNKRHAVAGCCFGILLFKMILKLQPTTILWRKKKCWNRRRQKSQTLIGAPEFIFTW